MARDMNGILTQHQNTLRDELPWIWLYELEVPTDPKTRYRITNYTSQIEFGTNTAGEPLVYYPFPIANGEIVQTGKGDLPRIRVSVANVTNEIGLTLDAYRGMVGSRAVVRLINLETVDDVGAQIRWDADVTRVLVRPEAIVFELSSYNIHKSRFPTWRYMSQHCNFRFGSPECGYVLLDAGTAGNTVGTGFDFCPKLLSACEERGDDEEARGLTRRHPYRYGGFQGIPGS